MPLYVLVNPTARFGKAMELVKPLEKHLEKTWRDVKIKVLKFGESIKGVIQRIDDIYNILIIVGGDGTIKSVVENMLNLKRRFTIIPFLGGTGGELARFTRILSIKDLENALKKGEKREIDAFTVEIAYPNGKREKHIFVANMQIGHFAQAIKETPLIAKKLLGSNGYMIGVLKAILKRVNKNCKVKCDKRTVYTGPIYTIHFGNLKTTRGGIPVTPLAKPNDGKIDMLLARSITKTDALKTLPSVLNGKHLNHPAVIYKQAQEVKIICKGEPVAIDGEYLGIFSKAEIKHKAKIDVLCNK